MLANPDVDGYTESLNHWETLRKKIQKQPTENQTYTKTET